MSGTTMRVGVKRTTSMVLGVSLMLAVLAFATVVFWGFANVNRCDGHNIDVIGGDDWTADDWARAAAAALGI